MELYEKYKESGIEWVGEIPEGWNVGLLKRYCNVTDGSHFSPKSQLTGKPYVTVKDVGVNYINLDDCNKISEDDFVSLVNNGCSPKVGDVLLTKDGTIGRAAVVTEEYKQFVVLSSLGILSPRNKVYSNFLYLYLISGINIDQMYSTIHGSALTRLTIDKINNLIFVCPPKSEQTTIANYLDRKTAEIDQLIAQKEHLLGLYEEEKTAIINQAVTQGINPDVKLKDSGIDWLGEIPEHWEISRVKNICKVRQGLQIPISDRVLSQTKTSLPYITIRAINNPNDITEYIKNPAPRVTCTTDDILVARTGATGEIITGIAGVFHNNFFLVDYSRLIMDKEFLVYFLKSGLIKEYLLLVAGTTTIPDLNHDDFYNTPFFLFSKTEQTSIVQHIEAETTRINAKITKTKKIISLQKEYRTALISEVVTGKIKVTQEVAS